MNTFTVLPYGPKLINTPDDMEWLRSVHIPDLPERFRSAVIVGNEDSPESIDCYEAADPKISDAPLRYTPDGDGVYICE